MDQKMQEFYEGLDLLYTQGRQNEIEAYLRKQFDKIGGGCSCKYNPMQVAVYNELGSFYRGQGKLEQAMECFEFAARLIVAHLGENVIEYATAVNNLAGAQRMAGLNDKARSSFQEALRIYEKTSGRDSYLYISAVNNLALLDISEGRYADAEERLRQALAGLESLKGSEQEKAITLCNLGTCSLCQKNYEQAQRRLEQSRTLYMSLPQEMQSHLAAVCNSLGNLYYYQGDIPAALEAYSEAQKLTERHFGHTLEYAITCESIARISNDDSQAALQLKQGIKALEDLGLKESQQAVRMQQRLKKIEGDI